MKISICLVLLSLFQLLKNSLQACCEDCINPLVNTELPTPVKAYSEPVHTTPDKYLMCSSKFTVEDGICCEQTSLEQHWLEFKAREEAKILPLKQLFANTRVRYFADIAESWMQTTSILFPPFELTTTRLDKFFKFRENYDASVAVPHPFMGTWLFDEHYINGKLTPAQRTALLPAQNLIDAIPADTETKIKDIFATIADKYTGVNAAPIATTNLTHTERSKFLSLNQEI